MKFNSDRSIEEIAASIRSIRKQKGLTLKEVEVQSGGIWKAVVVGSYERCDRALSLKKAISLAAFYQVPLDQLLGLEAADSKSANMTRRSAPRITFDLKRTLAKHEDPADSNQLGMVQTLLTLLCAKRRDWNGEVLSLRKSDLETLAIMTNMTEEQIFTWLSDRKFLIGNNRNLNKH
jgi:transcriptional regulator with XRE-family HTH domain